MLVTSCAARKPVKCLLTAFQLQFSASYIYFYRISKQDHLRHSTGSEYTLMPGGYDQVFETQSHCHLFATFQIKVAHTSICLSKSLVFCSDAWLLYWQKALDNAFRQAVASKDISSRRKESLVSHNQRKSPDPGRIRLEIITTVLSSTNKVRAGKLSFQIFVHKLYASIVSIDCWTTSTQRWLGPVV